MSNENGRRWRPYSLQSEMMRAARLAADTASETVGRRIEHPVRVHYPTQMMPEALTEWTCPECEETVGPHEKNSYYFAYCRCMREAYQNEYERHLRDERPVWVTRQLSMAGIPPRYSRADFDGFEARKGASGPLKQCQEYARSFEIGSPGGLFLCGAFGSGKTHLAVATLREAITRTMVGGLFVTAGELLCEIKAGFGDRGKGSEDILEAVCAVELLVLDDLGQENTTEFTRGVLFELIDSRYREALPTIITSNLGDKQLEERLGGAMVSRLYEMTRLVLLQAADYRKELARRATIKIA